VRRAHADVAPFSPGGRASVQREAPGFTNNLMSPGERAWDGGHTHRGVAARTVGCRGSRAEMRAIYQSVDLFTPHQRPLAAANPGRVFRGIEVCREEMVSHDLTSAAR